MSDLTPAEVPEHLPLTRPAADYALSALAAAGYRVVPEDRVVPEGYRVRPPHLALTTWTLVDANMPITEHERAAWDAITEGADRAR